MENETTSQAVVEPRHVLRRSDFKSRFIVLFLACMNMMVTYYCLDNPAALHDPLKHHFAEQFSEKRFEKYFNFLYSAYSLPNIILPLIGGVMIDRIGYRYMNLLFIGFLIIGHSMFAAGISGKDMDLALGGRAVYGLGGECILVGLSALLSDWFGGAGEFAMVMGVKMSLGRLGSVLNNIGSRYLYQEYSISFSVWFGVILLAISFILALIFTMIDIYADREIKADKERLRVEMSTRDIETTIDGLLSPTVEEVEEELVAKEFHLSDITKLRRTYWLLVISCVVIYGSIIPFNHVASAMIIEKFICLGKCCPVDDLKCAAQSAAENKASFVMGIPFITTCVLSPFVGFIVDKFGGNAILIMGSAITLIVVHLTIALSDIFWVLILFLVFLGLAYTIYASSLWPSVPATVKPEQVGTGYGLMTALQNVGLTIFPLCVAAIRGESGSYTYVEVFFTCLAFLGSLVTIYTYIYDKSQGGVLNMSSKERDEHIKNLATEGVLDSVMSDDSNEYGSSIRQRRRDGGNDGTDRDTRSSSALDDDNQLSDDDNTTLIRR